MGKFLPEASQLIGHIASAGLSLAAITTQAFLPEATRYVQILPDQCLAVSAQAIICNLTSLASRESRDVVVYVANENLGDWMSPASVSLSPRVIHWFGGMTDGLTVFQGFDLSVHAVMRGYFLSTFVDA